MAELVNPDGLERAKKTLRYRLADPKTMVIPGLRDDLRAILGGFEEIELRIGVIAHAQVRRHFGEKKLDSQTWSSLEKLAAGVKHGPDCKCARCLMGRL